MNWLPKLSRAKLYGNRFTCCTRQNCDIILVSVSVVKCRPSYATYHLAKYFRKSVFGDICWCCNEKSVKIRAILRHPRQTYLHTVWTACLYCIRIWSIYTPLNRSVRLCQGGTYFTIENDVDPIFSNFDQK